MAEAEQIDRRRVPEYEQRPYLNGYKFRCSYLHPRYWLTWLGMAMYWVIGRLPFPVIVALGKQIGSLLYRMGGRRLKITKRNLELCFPEKTPEQREALARENFRCLGVALLEPGIAWWARQSRIDRLVRFEGAEHVQNAMAKGKGVLLCAEHMVSMEMALRGLGSVTDFVGLYRVQNNPVFEYMSAVRRRRYVHRLLPRKQVREFLYFMRTGRAGLMLPDQDLGRKRSIFAPFFGIPAATVPTVSDFARQAGVSVVFGYFYRDGNKGYVIKFEPVLENFPTSDLAADTVYINKLIEDRIRLYPEQYLWQHRRFKHRPDGEPELY